MRNKKMGPLPAQAIPAGYTYFGQFIDHDLTYDTSALPRPGVETKPGETVNYRRTALNLETLYGDGPGSRDSSLYADDNASFRLGTASGDCDVFDVPLDEVPLDPSLRKALAADPRNLENALVRQVHALFLMLHNVAVADIPEEFPAQERFVRARQRVRHQYQWLVRHDFLSRFCNVAVYQNVIQDADPLVDWNGRFSIPVEFAQAAFRFGHSMVRSRYTLGNEDVVPLLDLLEGKNVTGPLSCKHRINWTDFLLPKGVVDLNPEIAMRIDTSIIPELYDIPPYALKVFVKLRRTSENFSLPLRTMQRAVTTLLPSGQSARDALREPGIASDHEAWADARQAGLAENTPLFYYVLLEAEVNEAGLRLGSVGSRLVAEVIEGALWADPESFLRRYGRHWRPEPWPIRGGTHSIESLHDVAVVAGLVDPMP